MLVIAAWLQAARVSSQGLFPPLHSPLNFATSRPVTATSTCGECEEEEEELCWVCNNTCPFGDSIPPPLDLVAAGTPQDGVVSTHNTFSEKNYSSFFASDHFG